MEKFIYFILRKNFNPFIISLLALSISFLLSLLSQPCASNLKHSKVFSIWEKRILDSCHSYPDNLEKLCLQVTEGIVH